MKRNISFVLVLMLALATLPVAALATQSTDGQRTGVITGSSPVTLVEGLWDGAQAAGSLSPGTGVIILQQFGDMLQVFARGARTIGWLKMDYVREDSVPEIQHTGVVISQNVSIRQSPATNAGLIATAKNGDVLEILSEQNGWYTVRYWQNSTTTVEGYARTFFVVEDPYFITTTQLTYVYAMPFANDKMVGQLVAGTQLVVIGEYQDYWVVNLRSASGFIRKGDVAYNQIVSGGNG